MNLKVYSIEVDLIADTSSKKGRKALSKHLQKTKMHNTKEIALLDLVENNNANLLVKKEYRKALKDNTHVLLIDRGVNCIMCNYKNKQVKKILKAQNRNK